MQPPMGASPHAEVVAVEQVVGGHVVESGRGFLAARLSGQAVLSQHAADNEIDDHPPHLAQELRDGHELVRVVRLLDHRVLAEGFQGRAGRGPYEVRPANARVPEVAEL